MDDDGLIRWVPLQPRECLVNYFAKEGMGQQAAVVAAAERGVVLIELLLGQ